MNQNQTNEQLLQKLYQGQTSEKQSRPLGIEPSIWQTVWSRLEAAKVVWEELDSSTSEYWRVSLDGYSEADLARGCDAADGWSKSKSDFTLGRFKKLCSRSVGHPSHVAFEAIENLPASKDSVARFRAQRKAETGI